MDTKVGFVPMELLGENGELDVDEVRDLGVVYQGFTYCRDGDVIVAKITPCFENGKGALCIGLKNGIGMGTTELHVLRPQEINGRYLYWITRQNAFREIGATEMRGSAGQQRVPIEFIKNWVVGLPSNEEQRTIAAFLDHTTDQLDDLIAQKQRLVELLKEKRQALITQAVTKGLNPKVKMKDSGVEWLGQIPEHWGVRALKRLVSIPITDGPHETPILHDSGVPFVSAEAIQNGKIEFGSVRGYISSESDEVFSRKYSPKRGDIYMVKSGATTGRIAMVETDERFNIWSPLAAIRCNPDLVLPEFMLMALQSDYFQRQIQLFWNYGTQQNIGMGVIGNLKFILPPLEEQREAIKRVVGLNRNIVELEFQVEKSTHELQEYRQSLISAAVTGKIDLRNWKTA
jgi:type I restriction enzyme S subunit